MPMKVSLLPSPVGARRTTRRLMPTADVRSVVPSLVSVMIISVTLLFVGSCHTEPRPIVEPPPWICEGTVFNRADGRPLFGVQVWVAGYKQTSSDSLGTYRAILGFERTEPDTISFRSPGYLDAIGVTDTAHVIADHKLLMNIHMVPFMRDHQP
jgi:hypothetical protein